MRTHAEQFTPAFSLIKLHLENAPKVERKAEPPKKKEKKEKIPAPVEAVKEKPVEAATSVKSKAEGLVDGSASKKDKKGKKEVTAKSEESGKKKAPAGQKPAAAEDAGEPVPSMIDLRVGHIIDGK